MWAGPLPTVSPKLPATQKPLNSSSGAGGGYMPSVTSSYPTKLPTQNQHPHVPPLALPPDPQMPLVQQAQSAPVQGVAYGLSLPGPYGLSSGGELAAAQYAAAMAAQSAAAAAQSAQANLPELVHLAENLHRSLQLLLPCKPRAM